MEKSDDCVLDLKNEISILFNLTKNPHKNVVELKHVFETVSHVVIIMPYYSGGELKIKYNSNKT